MTLLYETKTDRTAASDALRSARATIEIEREGLNGLLTALDGDLGQAFVQALELIESAGGSVVVSGMGKSGHIGRKLAATLSSTGTRSHFIHPAEASHGDLGVLRPDDVVFAMSWSGETTELADIVSYTRRFGIGLIGMTSRRDSALGKASDICLCLPAVTEACPNGLAPTTSTTLQLALGDALSVCLLKRRGFTAADFQQFHPGGKLGARLATVKQLMHVGPDLPEVDESATLSEAIVEMTSKRFGVTAVVSSDGLLTGILTDGDLRRAFKLGFSDRTVADCMSETPYVVGPDTLAVEVLRQLEQRRITCVFVVNGIRRPVGLLHIHDLLRAGLV